MHKIIATGSALAAVMVSMVLVNPMAATAGEVARREGNQQSRIYQGVKQGQISRQEFGRLERKEGKIDAQRRAMLRRDGGKLTPQDRTTLNRELNATSRQIYRDRHN